MNDVAIGLGAVAIIAAAWFAFGCWVGFKRNEHWWQDEMIRRRHAVYHWENGRWYWKEDEPTTPRDPVATKVAKMGITGL